MLPLSLSVAALAVLATGAPAHAAPKAISGKLSKPGYTLIALADSGKARVVRVRRSRFAVRPPARGVTLQLRRPDGVYAGPVVVGRRERGTRAIVGVRAGTSLGRVRVRRGYATVRRRLGDDQVLVDAPVRARRGKPIGAGKFGRVRSRKVRDPLPADRDLDGVPDVLDVDVDGDLVLDAVDSSAKRGRAAQVPESFGFFSRLTLSIDRTANANATGLTPETMDDALSTSSDLLLTVLPTEPDPNYPELDCGGDIQDPPRPVGLAYCRPHSAGGIGTIHRYPPHSNEVSFPDCCDLDGDGLGQLTVETPGDPNRALTLHHNADSSEIKTGDVMAQHVLRGGEDVAFLSKLQYVFASVPAVMSYRGETGPTRTVEYPYTPKADPDGDGPMPNLPAPFEVVDGDDPGDDVSVTLTFWPPQRSPVAAWGETGAWIDLGRLSYEVQVEYSGRQCPQTAFTENDDTIELNTQPSYGPGFTDTTDDEAANRNNTFTYTLNLSQCLEPNGFSFEPGETRGFVFLAHNRNSIDNAQQGIWFKRIEPQP